MCDPNVSHVELPDKASDLLRLAVREGRSLDREQYYPISSFYHSGIGPDRYMIGDMVPLNLCGVCLAGAIIAGVLNADPTKELSPSFCGDNRDKLFAIDSMRGGFFKVAIVTQLRIDITPEQEEALDLMEIPNPWAFQGWEAFEQHMVQIEKAAQQLEDIGL